MWKSLGAAILWLTHFTVSRLQRVLTDISASAHQKGGDFFIMLNLSIHARLLAGIAIGSLSVAAYAQEAPPQSQPSALSGSDIIVTATRRNESLVDVPLNVQAITSEDITNQAITNFSDIDTLVPGLSLDTTAQGNEASIRGVTTASVSGAPQSLDIYLNDVPVLAFSIFSALYDVGQIEVLRGPQGTLRGRTAPTGAITITSRRPDMNAFGGYVEGQMQSHERFGYTLQGAVGGPIIPDVLAFRLAGFYQQDDLNGTRSINNNVESEQRIKSGRATLLFTPGDRFQLLATYQYNETDEDKVARLAGAGRGYNGPPLTGEENSGVAEAPDYTNRQFHFASINAKYDFDFATLNYIGGWTKSKNTRKGRQQLDPGNAIIGLADIEVQQWSHELRLQSNTKPGDFLDWTVGYYRANGGSRVDQNTTLVSAGPGSGILGDPAIVGPTGPAVPTASDINLNYLTRGILRLQPGSFNIFGDPGRDLEQSLFASTTYNFDSGTHVRLGARYIWGHKDYDFNLAFDSPLRIAQPLGFPTAGVCGFLPPPFPGATFAPSSYPTSCDILIALPNPPSLDQQAKLNDWVYDINVRQELGEHLNAYASYARSFRSPGASQGDVPAQFVIVNAEKSDNYEIGLKGELFDRRARFTISAFQQDFKGYNATVSNIPFVSGGLANGTVTDAFSLTYNGDARVRGFEADISGNITDRWSARASVSYVKGKFKNASQPCRDANFDGVPDNGTPTLAGFQGAGVIVATCATNGPINGLPKWTATVQTEYSIPIGDRGEGFIRGLLNYKSDGLIVSSNAKIPEYATVDIYAGVNYDNFRASIFAKNLFDTTRLIDQTGLLNTLGSIPTGYREVFYTQGLQIGLNLGFRFGGG
jgi:iron complex outermembrane receptor protein